MIDRFISVWPIPKGIKETPERNILNIYNPTGKKIEYARLFGNIIVVKDFADLYRRVIAELYHDRPEGFVETFAEILNLKEDNTQLRRHAILNSTYYYETNLSATQIIQRLQRILEKLDLTDELFIKFKG